MTTRSFTLARLRRYREAFLNPRLETRVTGNKEEWMKYICLGYLEPGKFEGMTEDERNATLDDCFEYNDHLRSNGHLVAEVPASASGDRIDSLAMAYRICR